MAATIYLHWSATPYDWVRQGVYHTIVAGDGRLHRLHAYNIDLNTHTYRRNSNAIALSCACMGGRPDPWTLPPTPAQIEAMCAEVAAVARGWQWSPAAITIQRVMTHAEAASNRDGRERHDNYGPVIWGGSGERWDFLQLRRNGPTDGGDQLRSRIRALMAAGGPPPAASGAAEPLAFRRTTTMPARDRDLAVEIDANGTSWARVADLLALYEIPYEWSADQRRILIGSADVAPSYQTDAVQASIGWPLVELSLQGGQSPVILIGILRQGRAWCRVLEFAEEFGISVGFEPFTLGYRRGG